MVPPMEQASAAQVLAGFLDASQRLILGNVALAKVQLEREARQAARKVALGGLALVPAAVGWAFVCVAAALSLGATLGILFALLLVGGLNMGAGVLLFVHGTRKRIGSEDARSARAA